MPKCKSFLSFIVLFILWSQLSISGKVLFEEDFDSCPPGGFPPSLRITGNREDLLKDPVLKEFAGFHFEQNLRFVQSLRRFIKSEAIRQRGEKAPVTLSGNINGIFDHPRWSEFIPVFDYLSLEFLFDENQPIDPELLTLLKITESFNTPVLLMPDGGTNQRWKQNPNPDYYNMMTALIYALGHANHIPYCLWDGSYRDRWWADPAEHREIFQFIDQYQHLFDGYQTLASELVVIPCPAHSLISDPSAGDCLAHLLKNNIPFAVQLSGKHQRPVTEESIQSYEHVSIVGSLEACAEDDRNVLRKKISGQKPETGRALLAVRGAENLIALPRAHAGNPKAPVVIHLVNLNAKLQGHRTSIHPASGASLEIHSRLLKDHPLKRVVIHQPGRGSEVLEVEKTGQGVIMQLPEIPQWGLLEIHAGDQSDNRYLAHLRHSPVIRHSVIPLMPLSSTKSPASAVLTAKKENLFRRFIIAEWIFAALKTSGADQNLWPIHWIGPAGQEPLKEPLCFAAPTGSITWAVPAAASG